jgi:hypothetical protein
MSAGLLRRFFQVRKRRKILINNDDSSYSNSILVLPFWPNTFSFSSSNEAIIFHFVGEIIRVLYFTQQAVVIVLYDMIASGTSVAMIGFAELAASNKVLGVPSR